MTQRSIYWTPEKLESFKRVYARAKSLGVEKFQFEGYYMLVDYAKYLIEHLEHEFHRP